MSDRDKTIQNICFIYSVKQGGGFIMVWECYSASVVDLHIHIGPTVMYAQELNNNLLSHIGET